VTAPPRHAAPPAPLAASPPSARFAVEATPIGAQSLVPGIVPITPRDRLEWRAAAPLVSARPQRPCDCGLFDLAARDQLDLFAAPLAADPPADCARREAQSRGAAWLFLESGRDNRRAHDFFTRRGFTEISRVFARRLDG
jgi:hypothetical protein